MFCDREMTCNDWFTLAKAESEYKYDLNVNRNGVYSSIFFNAPQIVLNAMESTVQQCGVEDDVVLDDEGDWTGPHAPFDAVLANLLTRFECLGARRQVTISLMFDARHVCTQPQHDWLRLPNTAYGTRCANTNGSCT